MRWSIFPHRPTVATERTVNPIYHGKKRKEKKTDTKWIKSQGHIPTHNGRNKCQMISTVNEHPVAKEFSAAAR